MLAKLPAERYQTPAEVARALSSAAHAARGGPRDGGRAAEQRHHADGGHPGAGVSGTGPLGSSAGDSRAGSDRANEDRHERYQQGGSGDVSASTWTEANPPALASPVLVGLVATNANAQMQDRCNINGPPWLTLVGGAVPRGIHHIEVPRTFGAPHPRDFQGRRPNQILSSTIGLLDLKEVRNERRKVDTGFRNISEQAPLDGIRELSGWPCPVSPANGVSPMDDTPSSQTGPTLLGRLRQQPQR